MPVDAAARPDETPTERADRNFADLLQELRVGQTGVQILFAFLLTIPFQARYPELDAWQRQMLVAALVLSALTTVCFVAPVAYHRLLFRQGLKREVVDAANSYARAGLAFFVLALGASLQLVLDVVVGRERALWTAGGLVALLVVVWGLLPALARRKAA